MIEATDDTKMELQMKRLLKKYKERKLKESERAKLVGSGERGSIDRIV